MFRNIWTFATRSRSHIFIVLGLLTLLLRIPMGLFPAFTEGVYSRGFFLGVRYLLDYTIGWSPIPFSYIVILALIGYWTWKVLRKAKPTGPKFKRALLNLAGFAGAFLFFFHFLWGFNYERTPIEQHLGLQLDSMTVDQLCFEAEWAARQAEADRAAIPGVTTDSLSDAVIPADLEERVRTAIASTMQAMDYPYAGRVRGRVLVPGGWMLRVGIGGIYNPFTGEGNVSGAQTPQKIPYTMAHEMAHGCGFGDEGSCMQVYRHGRLQPQRRYLHSVFRANGLLGRGVQRAHARRPAHGPHAGLATGSRHQSRSARQLLQLPALPRQDFRIGTAGEQCLPACPRRERWYQEL